MALPKIDTPIHRLLLPVSKKTISYRPWLMKEHKLLLLANESKEIDDITQTIKQIINNCNLSENVEIDTLPLVDLEYLFLNLRAKSVGEISELNYSCKNTLEDGSKCDNPLKVEINLLDIKVEDNNYNDVIQLTSKIGLKMKYPSLEIIEQLSHVEITQESFDIIIKCIDYIYDENNFYYVKDTPKQEVVEFLENLNSSQFKKIDEYFSNMPSLKKEIDIVCDKCGYHHKIILNGLDDFL